MQGNIFYQTKPSLTLRCASGDWTLICREDSRIEPGEGRTKEALVYREKNGGVWNHTDLVGVSFWSVGYVTLGSDLASLKLSFLIYKRGYCNKVSGPWDLWFLILHILSPSPSLGGWPFWKSWTEHQETKVPGARGLGWDRKFGDSIFCCLLYRHVWIVGLQPLCPWQ